MQVRERVRAAIVQIKQQRADDRSCVDFAETDPTLLLEAPKPAGGSGSGSGSSSSGDGGSAPRVDLKAFDDADDEDEDDGNDKDDDDQYLLTYFIPIPCPSAVVCSLACRL
jgi:hypothetical protein